MLGALKYYYDNFGLNGVFHAINSKIFKKVNLLEVNNELRHPFFLRMPSSDLPTFQQVFVDNEYEFETGKEPDVIVDAGANIGLASIVFANRFPNAKIIAIEPEASNFDLLKKNVEMYKNVIPVQAALWNESGEIDLVDPGLGSWGFMTENGVSDSKLQSNVCHKVKSYRVDDILHEFELEKIDILKIDIEGAEKEVFEDVTSWINSVNSLIVELHERMKPGCTRTFFNATNGFDTEWIVGENVYLSKNDTLRKSNS